MITINMKSSRVPLKETVAAEAWTPSKGLHQLGFSETCAVDIDMGRTRTWNNITTTINNNDTNYRSDNRNNNNNQRNKVFTVDMVNTNCSNTAATTTTPVAQQLVQQTVDQQQQQNLPVQQGDPASVLATNENEVFPQATGISIISAQNMGYGMVGNPTNTNQSFSQTEQPGYPQSQGPPPPGYQYPPPGYQQYPPPPPPGYQQYPPPPPPGYYYQGQPPPGYQYAAPPAGYPQSQAPPPQAYYGQQTPSGIIYAEGTIMIAKFERPEDRMKFIRGVYSILLVQLVCFFGFVLLMNLNEAVRMRFSHPALIWLAMGMYMGVVIGSFCCCPEQMMTTNPISVGTLIVITFALSLLSGVIAGRMNPKIVLLAVGLTLIIVLALTLIAFTCSYDFTQLDGIMCVALLILMLFGIVTMFLKDEFPILDLIYGYLGAGIFCMYIIIDTQMLMSGKSKSLAPTMYILGAITLFIDIVQLFLFILKILNGSESGD